MHSDSYATVLSISGNANAHILWYTTPKGELTVLGWGGVKFFRREVFPPLGWLDKPLLCGMVWVPVVLCATGVEKICK